MDAEKIFEGLDCYGFQNLPLQNIDLYENQSDKKEEMKQSEEIKVEQFLFYKKITCPVCGHTFEERMVRKSKLKLLSSDEDLKPNYAHIVPAVYDVYLCEQCGYAATSQYFDKLWSKMTYLIEKNISPFFRPKSYPFVLSIEQGIERYKLALLNAVVKKAKNSEKAFICMKISWLYRDLHYREQELVFLKKACEGFILAYEKESFPICNSIDENTLSYMLAAFYKNFGQYDKALKWLSNILTDHSIHRRLRERAVDLKLQIQQERKKNCG